MKTVKVTFSVEHTDNTLETIEVELTLKRPTPDHCEIYQAPPPGYFPEHMSQRKVGGYGKSAFHAASNWVANVVGNPEFRRFGNKKERAQQP